MLLLRLLLSAKEQVCNLNHEPACEQGALEPHILLLYKVLRTVFHACQLLVKALTFTDRTRSTGEYSVHMAILPIVDELLSDSHSS